MMDDGGVNGQSAVMSAHPPFVRLDGARTTLVVDCRGDVPTVAHWGRRLAADTDLAALAALAQREAAPGAPSTTPPMGLSPLIGSGWPGRPGVSAHRSGRDWATWAQIARVTRTDGTLEIVSDGAAQGILMLHRMRLSGDVLTVSTTLTNTGETPLRVEACDAPALPVPAHLTHWLSFEGRWAGEFQTRRIERGIGAIARENRRGRTSHDAFPLLLAEETGSETAGEALGFHLAWSGNHRMWAETLNDARGYAMFGALFLPGELTLAPGASYTSPDLVVAWSDAGRSGIARAFQAHVRARPQHDRLRARPRPVHYNSWEAVYFDHSPDRLMALADAAANIGVERFVLDDGWMTGRRSDRVGLGDWTVDRGVYPKGLHPLIERVRGQGMEFGLWVEPEMCTPDSEVARAHPDWILACPPAPQLDFRHQFVLDFSRAEVRDHVWRQLAALLDEYPIAYLKWDMNRDLSHAGGADGRAAAVAHVEGVYALLDRLREHYPAVEVETCASGGGRADLGMLARTDRVWASDTNDALDRLTVQRGLSTLLPPELVGSHVGPATCHITGRHLSMRLRVATAIFGHFGVEADLTAMSDADRAQLAAGIALHKRHRDLIHSGALYRLDRPAGEIAFGIVAATARTGLFSLTQITAPVASFATPLRLAGLDPAATYRVTPVWPAGEALTATGELLMHIGVQPPRLQPQHAIIWTVEATRGS